MASAKRSPRHNRIAAEPWPIWLYGRKLADDMEEPIYDVVHSIEAIEYWKRKDDLTEDVLKKVDWESIGLAMKEEKWSRRIFVSKHVSSMCGVGKFAKRWKIRQDDSCPHCGKPEGAAGVLYYHGEGSDEI